MTSICVLSTSCILPNMARASDGPHANRPASDFAAILKAKADPEPVQAGAEETQAQLMQAAAMPRRPDVDAMLLQLSAWRKMVLSVAARSGRPAPASAADGATLENCALAEEDGIEDSDEIDAACADGGAKVLCAGYVQGLPSWRAGHCAHGRIDGSPVECALQPSAMGVALPAYTMVWTPVETLWRPMQSPSGQFRRRQRRRLQGNKSNSKPRDQGQG